MPALSVPSGQAPIFGWRRAEGAGLDGESANRAIINVSAIRVIFGHCPLGGSSLVKLQPRFGGAFLFIALRVSRPLQRWNAPAADRTIPSGGGQMPRQRRVSIDRATVPPAREKSRPHAMRRSARREGGHGEQRRTNWSARIPRVIKCLPCARSARVWQGQCRIPGFRSGQVD
jgi:hypothetical protein